MMELSFTYIMRNRSSFLLIFIAGAMHEKRLIVPFRSIRPFSVLLFNGILKNGLPSASVLRTYKQFDAKRKLLHRVAFHSLI